MPQLTWPEVKNLAFAFSKSWAKAVSEHADKQTFWNEFFAVFGRDRRAVAAFEVAVRNVKGSYGRIDLLWRGVLLVEHKSEGKPLDAAESQAFAYIEDLARDGRFDEIPRYVIVSDFARIALYDLEPEEQSDLPLFAGRRYTVTHFPLPELHRYIRHFAFLKGEQVLKLDPEDPANQRAYDRMCQLHEELERLGFTGEPLERLLVRLLFCLFADDTAVFEPNTFETFVRTQTREDGSDLGSRLNQLFYILHNPEDRWSAPDRETFAGFRYVNGDLFKDALPFPPFTRATRDALLFAAEFQWARVSPAVFGSLFQGILEKGERRRRGVHYTSERDVMKVIRSLFLDYLEAEFIGQCANKGKGRIANLRKFHDRLRELRFLDPACGCGSFLVLAYRELRELELKVLREIHSTPGGTQQVLDIRQLILVDVDQFYGIELSEWPARITEVAMWLMDHQMNQRASEAFGQSFERLPLRTSPTIHIGNALEDDWRDVLPPKKCSYILGNPPFSGAKFMEPSQRADMQRVAGHLENYGLLDYVTGWYFKAADYIRGTRIVVGFVSTNSITQGEQVAPLWRPLLDRYHIQIHFAHRSFPWASEARGGAHVHVVIIGFARFEASEKRLFDYGADVGRPTLSSPKNINPYLTDAPNVTVSNIGAPISVGAPPLAIGNKPIDGGHYLFTAAEKASFTEEEPQSKRWFRRWLGAEEFINSIERWCLWLGECPPEELQRMPEAKKRVEAVRDYRLKSKSEPTRKLASKPREFHVTNIPDAPYLVIPEVSSERRTYIPLGFLTPDILASNKLRILRDATLWHFGILSSAMHMAWVRQVTGRLEQRFQYSVKLVYNNFPWPSGADAKRRAAVESAAQAVLDARKPFLPPHGASSLADLYDPLTMPSKLAEAHRQLDLAVDRCYESEKFDNDPKRLKLLFFRYADLTAPLLHDKSRRRKPAAKQPVPDIAQAESTESTDEEVVGAETELPEWYLSALAQIEAGKSDDGLDAIYDRVDELVGKRRLGQCNRLIATIAQNSQRSPITALVGLLTITRASAARLPSRVLLDKVTRQRLAAVGKDADRVLRGL